MHVSFLSLSLSAPLFLRCMFWGYTWRGRRNAAVDGCGFILMTSRARASLGTHVARLCRTAVHSSNRRGSCFLQLRPACEGVRIQCVCAVKVNCHYSQQGRWEAVSLAQIPAMAARSALIPQIAPAPRVTVCQARQSRLQGELNLAWW